MRLRHSLFGLLIACLVWLTAATVSALWKSPQSKKPAPPPAVVSSVESRMRQDLTANEVEILDRVDRRLKKNPLDNEAALLKGLLYFKAGQLDQALAQLDQLTRREPKFHLAHLIRGDLLLARVGMVSDFGDSGLLQHLEKTRGCEGQIDRLRSEARARIKGYLSLVGHQRIPRALVTLADAVKAAVVVDKSEHRLYLYENPGSGLPPRLLSDYYIVTGKRAGNKRYQGDQRTPEGVYFITRHIAGSALPDRYGLEAFPLNYPNQYDRRRGKTGDGIWLHGTEGDLYSRPPMDSDGCVVLTNDNLAVVAPYLQPGKTPVIIADHLEWLNPEQWRMQRRRMLNVLHAWRDDWASGKLSVYLRHYAGDFRSGRYSLRGWRRYKKAVLAGKRYQSIDLSGITIVAYPPDASGGRPMVVADFEQSYRSNNYNSDSEKRLYLVREDQRWKIWYEGSL